MVVRFRFVHEGRVIVGPVQGSGGLVSPERLMAAKRLAARGRSHGLYEPLPGHVKVLPHYSALGDGEPVFVPIAALIGQDDSE